MIRAPSVKTLMTIAGMEPDRARLLRRVLKTETRFGLKDLVEKFPDRFKAARDWLRSCYNPPSKIELKLEMANDLCDGYGVEGFGECNMFIGPPLLYVNMGDSYDTTLCRFRGAWRVACWADFAENPKHRRLFE